MLAELRARLEREDEIARKNRISRVYTVTTTSNTEVSNDNKPPIVNGNMVGVGKDSTSSAKLPKTTKIVANKNA